MQMSVTFAVKLGKWFVGEPGSYRRMSLEEKVIVALSGFPLIYNVYTPDYKDMGGRKEMQLSSANCWRKR